ncbi:MAG: SIS domain-containing protein, partial [Candidatus Freyarchaeota archaeon]|nr:SIS domain-containing protein [Candidatus Jordarchaeia archaeon]
SSSDQKKVEDVLNRIRGNVGKVDYAILAKVGEEIAKADRIFIVGRGRSEFVGKIFAIRLLNRGYRVYFVGLDVVDLIPPVDYNDLVIAISGSGETLEVVSAVKTAKEIGCRVVAVTSHPNSTVGKMSDVVLKIEGREEKTEKSFLERTVSGELEPPGGLFELSAIIVLESLANSIEIKRH